MTTPNPAKTDEAQDEMVKREARRPFVRYWFLMAVLVELPIVSDIISGGRISRMRIALLVVWVLGLIVLVVAPRTKLATLSSAGVTFRKRSTLPWSDVERIEYGPARHFPRIYRLMFGDGTMLSFVPKRGAAIDLPANALLARRRTFWGGPFVLLGFQVNTTLTEIIGRAQQYSDEPIPLTEE